jgi:hypothetical protein
MPKNVVAAVLQEKRRRTIINKQQNKTNCPLSPCDRLKIASRLSIIRDGLNSKRKEKFNRLRVNTSTVLVKPRDMIRVGCNVLKPI